MDLEHGWQHSARQVLTDLVALDEAIYATIASTPTRTLDEPIRRLSNAANNSAIWAAIAAALAILGGRPGRRAAFNGLLAVGATSALVNQGIKRIHERGRPDRTGSEVPPSRHVRMPASTSFPSGHSASGFAFAVAVGDVVPLLALPLRMLAGAVAYSRVHTGVHFPGDAVIGSIVGGAAGDMVAAWARRRRHRH